MHFSLKLHRLLAVISLVAAFFVMGASHAQTLSVSSSPASFSAQGDVLTLTYSFNSGSFVVSSLSVTSAIPGVSVTCQNTSTCTATYTVTAFDESAGVIIESASFTATRNSGGSLSGTAPQLRITKSGGGGATNATGSASPSTTNYNEIVNYSVQVTATGSGTPTGTITFSRNGKDFDTAPLINGSASLSTRKTLPGSGYVYGTFTSDDGSFGGSVALISQTTIAPPPPVASSSSLAVDYGTAGTVDLNGNVTGFKDGIEIASNPAHGTARINGYQVTYTPAVGYFGQDSFQYRAVGPGGSSSPASVDVTVRTPPAPVAVNGSNSVPFNSPGTSIGLAALTTGVATSYSVAIGPSHGTVSLAGSTVTYVPNMGYAGSDTFTFTATGPGGTSNAATITVTIPQPTISLSPSTLGAMQVGSPFSASLNAVGGTSPYTYSVTSGALPNGMSLSTGGQLTGTPTTGSLYAFTITARDSSGSGPYTASQAYSGTIAAPTITLSGSASNGNAGQSYAANLGPAVGGTAPYRYAITSGALPAGVELDPNTGALSGTPTVAGSFNFTVQATDSSTGTGPFTGSRALTLVISAPTLDLSPSGNSIAADYGQSMSQTFSASGGVAPFHYTLSGTLPTGLSWDAASATLSGTPTQTGSFPIAITATDSTTGSGAPFSIARSYFVVVGTPPPPTVGATSASVGYNSPAAIDVSSLIQGFYTNISIAQAPAHATTSVAGTVITYTPAAGYFGADTLQYSASGPGGTSTPALIAITVAPPGVPVAAARAESVPFDSTGTAIDLSTSVSGVYAELVLRSAPAHGTVSLAGNVVTYIPTAGYHGADTFTYAARGPGGTSADAVVTLTIGAPPPPVVTSPAPIDIAFDNENGASINLSSLVSGNYDTVEVVSPPLHGKLTIARVGVSFTGIYVPNDGFAGEDSFSVRAVGPGGASAPARIVLRVAAPKPVAGNIDDVQMIAGGTANVDLTQKATGGPFVSAAVVSVSPSDAGQASVSGTTLRFDASPLFSGQAKVTFTLANAYATSAAAIVTINVVNRADPSKDPEVIGLINAQTNSARRFADAQITNYGDRLRQLRRGGDVGNSQGISLRTGQDDRPAGTSSDPEPLGYFAEPKRSRVQQELDKTVVDRRAPPRFNVWTAGQIDVGDTDGSASQPGLDFRTQGVSAGVDYRFDERFIAGLGVGYGHDRSYAGENGTRSDGESWSVAGYTSWRPLKDTYIETVLGYGALSFDSRRYLTESGGFADGSRDGQQVFASLKAGYEVTREAVYFSPYAGIEASWTQLDAFSETSGGSAALHYGDQDVNSLVTVLGFETDYTFKLERARLIPSFKAEWRYDLSSDSDTDLNYLDWVGGPLFNVENEIAVRNAVRLEIGLDTALDQGFNIGLGYNTTLGEGGAIRHGLTARLGMRF